MKNITIEAITKCLTISSEVTKYEQKIIESMFDLVYSSTENIKKVRDEVVKYTSDKKIEARENSDWEAFDIYNNAMSKVVAVIDIKLNK